MNDRLYTKGRSNYNDKYCIKKDEFIQMCIEKINCVNDNDNDNEDEKENNKEDIGGKSAGNYKYQLVYRKGDINGCNDKDIYAIFKDTAKRTESIVWKDDAFLDFNNNEYAFFVDSVTCSCDDQNKGFVIEIVANH